MRLLLLLSALFTALAGVTGTRVEAHPVQASVAASASAVAAATKPPLVIRMEGAAFGRMPPQQPPLKSFVAAAKSSPLYADRRRE